MDRRNRHDIAQAATTELTRVANRYRPAGNFDHNPVHFGLQQIRSEEPGIGVEAIDAQKQDVGAELAQSSLRQGTDQGKRFLRSVPPVRITSMCVPANSAAMLIALVITVSRFMSFRARAMAVVVVPESSKTDCPSSTRRTAARAICIFCLR